MLDKMNGCSSDFSSVFYINRLQIFSLMKSNAIDLAKIYLFIADEREVC